MKQIAISIFCICLGLNTWAQNEKKPALKTRTVYSESFEKASLGQIVESKIEYDQHGNILKEYDYNKEGKLKNYKVYTYNASQKKESETLYSADNKIIEKHVYMYNSHGDRVLRTTYNGANKVIKKKVYSYEYY